MIQSMTGYAAASRALSSGGALTFELRSVNARFLDVQLRTPDELRGLEPKLREAISGRLARGKVECRLAFNAQAAAPGRVALEPNVVAQLRALSVEVVKAMPHAIPLGVADVLRWPGVLAEPALSEEEMRAAVAALCERALEELVASRSREGAKLARAVAERVAAMRARLEEVAPRVPQALAAYQAKLAERVREAIGSATGAAPGGPFDERVRAELALFAAKVDVDEELTRLRAHLAEVERTLERGGAVGKRLDFLAQELNREANTLASKSASQEISDCALELKLLIEQIREQVQNLE